jgi:hypothetical protein
MSTSYFNAVYSKYANTIYSRNKADNVALALCLLNLILYGSTEHFFFGHLILEVFPLLLQTIRGQKPISLSAILLPINI